MGGRIDTMLLRCWFFILRRLGLIARFLRPRAPHEEEEGKRDKRSLKLVHGCSPFPTEFGLTDSHNTQPTRTGHNQMRELSAEDAGNLSQTDQQLQQIP